MRDTLKHFWLAIVAGCLAAFCLGVGEAHAGPVGGACMQGQTCRTLGATASQAAGGYAYRLLKGALLCLDTITGTCTDTFGMNAGNTQAQLVVGAGTWAFSATGLTFPDTTVQTSAGISGSGLSGRVPFFNGASSVTSTLGFGFTGTGGTSSFQIPGKIEIAGGSAAVSGGLNVALRSNAGALEISQNGGAYAAYVAGVSALGAVGGTTNANGGTISGTTLTLAPADGSFPGLVSTGAQTMGAGIKTFTSAINVGTPIAITGTGTNIITSSTANSGSVSALRFNTVNTISTVAGRYTYDFQNNGVAMVRIDGNGNPTLAIEGNFIGFNGDSYTTWIGGNATSHNMEMKSNVSNSGTQSAYVYHTANALTGSTDLFEYENNGAIKVKASNSGDISAVGTNPVPSLHASQSTAAQALEYGSQALTTGSATFNFATAFASAPVCVCEDTTAVLSAQCTTSASVLTITGTGSDVVKFICIGAR